MKPYLIILYLVLTVILGAVADGLNERGKRSWGHPIEALSIGLLLAGPFLFFCEITIGMGVAWTITYTCFRIAFFDYAKNIAKGDPLFYLGTSNLWDKLFSKLPPHGVTFMRVIFLVVGISIPFKYLR